MGFVIRIVVNAFALWVVSLIAFLGVTITPFGDGGALNQVLTLLVVAVVFALVNTIVGTVIKVVAFPLYILTLGLISLVVNGFLLWLTAWITSGLGWGLGLGDFWQDVLAAVVIGLINGVFGVILRPQRKRARS